MWPSPDPSSAGAEAGSGGSPVAAAPPFRGGRRPSGLSGGRRGVRELVRAMTGELPDVKDTPLANWPIIEHFMPN